MVGTITIPMSQMKKLMQSKVKGCHQDPTVGLLTQTAWHQRPHSPPAQGTVFAMSLGRGHTGEWFWRILCVAVDSPHPELQYILLQ